MYSGTWRFELGDLRTQRRIIKKSRSVEENIAISDFLEVDDKLIVAQYPTDSEILKSVVNNDWERHSVWKWKVTTRKATITNWNYEFLWCYIERTSNGGKSFRFNFVFLVKLWKILPDYDR